jgi:hypothetical protein
MKNRSDFIFPLLIIYAIIAALTILFFNGTGDAGDSILHYLFAKSAPVHPQLYFDHWAKPVYVLLASPFAHFGFTGIKIFNAVVSLFTIFFTYKIAWLLNLRNALICAVILIFAPLNYILTFSGLTEPLFALVISIGLYTMLKQKYIASCIIVSFLPFVRSEGLIITGVFAFYLLLKKEWKLIPWLLSGHIVYSVAGYFVYENFLWVFTKIPYASLGSAYGSGKLLHFVDQMVYVTGVPIYILFWVGVISIVWKSVARKISPELQILVFLGFIAFFVAHSLFWYFGVFNSMGLKRVLIGVIPLIALIALMGYNFITEEVFKNKKNARLIIQGLLLGYIMLFPFTANPAAINWDRDMKLSKDQVTATRVVGYITRHFGTGHRFFYAHTYISELLNIDHFDPGKHLDLTRDFMSKTKPGDIIIWENWFCVVENDVTKETLDQTPGLVNIYSLSNNDNGHEILYSVYQRK